MNYADAFLNMSNRVVESLGETAYVLKDAIADLGPQTPAIIPNPLTAKWHKVIGCWGPASQQDVRFGRLTGGSTTPPGQQREERSFVIAGNGISFKPSPEDRFIEGNGSNWAIVDCTERRTGGQVIEYVLSLRRLPR